MKKLMILLGVVLMVAGLSGCSKVDENKLDVTNMTSSELVAIFVDAGYPIGEVEDYTAESDLNHLLGRPGAYTSKTTFADSRLKQITLFEAPPLGGTFEVFDNEADAQNRISYLHQIVGTSGPFFQYEYSYKNVYFRIEGALTPQQALQYEQAFNDICDGDLPQTYVEWSE